MKYLLLLLCFQAIYLEECDSKTSEKYICSKEKLQDDKCLMFSGQNLTNYLRNCPIDQKCLSIVTEGKDKMGYCVNRIRKKFGNEKCGINAECFSNSCVDEYCVFLTNGAVCEKHEDCSSQSYCLDSQADKKNNCVALKAPGDKCDDNVDKDDDKDKCTAGYACGSSESDGTNAVCTKMFSLPLGKISSNHLLCESGFAHKYSDYTYSPFTKVPKSGLCSTSKLTSEEICSKEKLCKYEINGGGQFITKDAIGKCDCTADGTKSYCTIDTDNEVWKNYLKEYKSAVDGITVSDSQNTLYLRANGWGKPKVMQARVNVERYAEFKSADECAIRYLSFSGILESSLTLLVTLITLLI